MGRPYMPDVPAAGHIADNGFWHPGAESNCPKSPCSEHNRRADAPA